MEKFFYRLNLILDFLTLSIIDVLSGNEYETLHGDKKN